MNSKQKGDIAETKALYELTKLGIQTSIPYGDNCRYDLIIDINNILYKVQVKYCGQKINDNNSIICQCSSSLNHTTNKKHTTYMGEVDYFIFYIEHWDVLLLVDMNVINNHKTITFRKNKTQNNQDKNVHYVEDYTFEKQLRD